MMMRNTTRLCLSGLVLAVLCPFLAGGSSVLAQSDTTAGADTGIREQLTLLTGSEAGLRQQALSALASSRDGRLVDFLQHYSQGAVFLWQNRVVVCPDADRAAAPLLDPLSLQPLVVDGRPAKVRIADLQDAGPSGRAERRAVADAVRLLEIWLPDSARRLSAIQRFGDSRDPKFLQPLQELIDSDSPSGIVRKARDSSLLIQASGRIPDQPPGDRRQAIQTLGELCVSRAVPLLKEILKSTDSAADREWHPVSRQALDQIESYQTKVRFLQNIFNGFSLGSILILMALGLSIIFGQMGVINMAHGELMMIGAYATYEMQLLFGHSPDTPSNFYYIAALPVSFMAAALVGLLIERLVVRHLYGRPLDTLLATWGVSLILIQCVRVKYGDNIGVNSPSWLVGSFEFIQDLVIPYNRAFILVLCGVCVLAVYVIFQHTRLGLLIRATVQGRETAASHGVNTGLVDGLTFALGSGLAGVAGYAWTVVGGVTPDMGQNHIVDSFLVVVTGGVGKLAGSVAAGLGIGTLNKILEPLTFGEGLFTMGIITALLCWGVSAIRAFRENRQLGLLVLSPIPGPLPLIRREDSVPGIRTAVIFYIVGIAGVLVSWMGDHLVDWFGDGQMVLTITAILAEPVRAIWAKVLILMCVVLFIQWRPLGLFPPKGRLADA
jgi:urea transport system permease protein